MQIVQTETSETGRFNGRTITLREAGAIIFALLTVLPLLVVVFFLTHGEPLTTLEAQASLLLAVLVALFGFMMFRRVVGQISRLAEVIEQPMPAIGAATAVEAAVSPVPGLGRLAEVSQLGEAFGRLLGDLRTSTERLEDLVFKLGTLNEMVELAARIPQLQDLLALVLERAMRTVRAGVGSIMLLDPERQTLRIAAARGLPDEAVAGVELRVGEGIAGKVAQLGEPVLVDNIEADPRFKKSNDPKYGGGSFICLPVRAGNRILGVINLAKKEPGPLGPPGPLAFGRADLQFLNALVTYGGYAVDNSRLLEETRVSAARLRRTLDELTATQAQLVQSEALRAVGELAAGLAHHLNNLLAVVSGRIGIALSTVHETEVHRSLEIADQATRDAAEVVGRLGKFAHAGAAAGSVDLNELVEEVLELSRLHWQYEAQRRGIEITVSFEAGKIPMVRGEPASLREVLMSLVLNAIDALPRGGPITVRTGLSGERVHCSVADAGTGMPETVRRRVLDPFFTTKGPKRMGLGLSVAYRILQRQGGDLVVESAEGQGTRVTISLPVPSPSGN